MSATPDRVLVNTLTSAVPPGQCGQLWESDVDLVLTLDALTLGPVTRELYRLVGRIPTAVTVERSATRNGGRETDVLLTGDVGVLLIEDKVAAHFQPDQPESYRDEVLRLRAAGSDAWAVLVCPASRVVTYAAQAHGCFDRIVTLEHLAAVAATSWSVTRDRLAYAAAAVLAGAAQAMPRTVDRDRLTWGKEYSSILGRLAPAGTLAVGPGCFRSAHSEVAWFADVAFDGLYGFGHRIREGLVQVELQKSHHERPLHVPPGSILGETKKLWLIRRPSPEMTFERPPSSQHEAVAAAVEAAISLLSWLRTNYTAI